MALRRSISRLQQAVQPTPKTIPQQLRKLFFSSWLNLLFVTVPIGFALFYTKSNPIATFLINLAAVLPCSVVLGTAAEDLILRIGPFVGATLYMTAQ
jgi:Ca2+:H+ antiporter